ISFSVLEMSQVIKSAPSSPLGKLNRKVGDLSLNKTPGSASRRGNVSLFGGKTPNQSFNHSSIFGCAGGKQGGRGLTKRDLTPSRNPNRTFNGTTGGGDRFIPSRCQTQFDYANYMLSQPEDSTFNTSLSAPNSPQKNPEKEGMKQMMRTKSSSDMSTFNDERIFVYKKNMAPPPPTGHLNQPKVLYSTSALATSSVRRTARHIPAVPERILDAPSFIDDYYTNVLDWSSTGLVAVGLGFDVYMWNSETGAIDHLIALDENDDGNTITALKWDADGKYISLGTMDGTVRLYDPERCTDPNTARELRKMTIDRSCRTGVLAWRHHVVSAGHRSGQILHHDVRVARHQIGEFVGHTQEVCGMKWSPDLKYLASGGGDNIVNVWNANDLTSSNPAPVYILNEHVSTVRAIQWCPWKPTTLATGGGTQDRTLKLWDVNGGRMMKSIDAGSQVTDIIFNSDYKEVMTSHGIPDFEIKIWKYPNFSEVATLGGHTARVLSLAQSPCGQQVMSAAADESLRIWNCFKIDKSTAKLAQRKALGGSIR
ncbi:hypothetical protein PFISCL1PPCAC_5977, partial [Pristionchus fissidentatus]